MNDMDERHWMWQPRTSMKNIVAGKMYSTFYLIHFHEDILTATTNSIFEQRRGWMKLKNIETYVDTNMNFLFKISNIFFIFLENIISSTNLFSDENIQYEWNDDRWRKKFYLFSDQKMKWSSFDMILICK